MELDWTGRDETGPGELDETGKDGHTQDRQGRRRLGKRLQHKANSLQPV